MPEQRVERYAECVLELTATSSSTSRPRKYRRTAFAGIKKWAAKELALISTRDWCPNSLSSKVMRSPSPASRWRTARVAGRMESASRRVD